MVLVVGGTSRHKEPVFGRRSVDQISHVWLGMSCLTDEQFERLFAQRNNRMVVAAGDG